MSALLCPVALLLAANAACVRPPRAAPATAASEAPRPRSATDPELDPQLVANEVKPRLHAIKVCFENELAKNPGLTGKIVLHWTIDPTGATSNVSTEMVTMQNATVERCLQDLIRTWRFPAPAGGSVDVSFPFIFQSTP